MSWIQCVSETTGRPYWFNTTSGQSVWVNPEGAPPEEQERVAIIVPFRDLHSQQQRMQHLKKFVPYITTFMLKSTALFKIYIIEQSNDGRKFNRGKLLNVGFALAIQDQCSVFVFHDVDLLPSDDLLPYYSRVPTIGPVHVARRWNRYNPNPRYFGGIAVFSQQSYERLNGYPNNYWGWGGEDDELRNRIEVTNTDIVAPSHGTITDLEDLNLTDKLEQLRSQPQIKCMNKKELLAEHEQSWQSNGLSTFALREEYKIVKVECLTAFAIKITVELTLNGHWTDQQCTE